jgi:hypothetical protein
LNQISPVKLIALTLCSTFVLFTTACGPSRPSEADGRAALERHYNSLEEVVKVDSLKKTDGQDGNMNGIPFYVMSYEATSECIAASGCGVCPTGVGVSVASQSFLSNAVRIGAREKAAGRVGACTLFDKGSKFTTNGKLNFAKSENGWTGQ